MLTDRLENQRRKTPTEASGHIAVAWTLAYCPAVRWHRVPAADARILFVVKPSVAFRKEHLLGSAG